MKKLVSVLLLCCLLFALGFRSQKIYVDTETVSFVDAGDEYSTNENDDDKTQRT